LWRIGYDRTLPAKRQQSGTEKGTTRVEERTMCLAIPAKILSIGDDRVAETDILGVRRAAALDLVPQAQVGDFILVLAGYGIEVVREQFANETLDLIREFPDLIAGDR
jgi:hydrogenase expression/formation protein HypC